MLYIYMDHHSAETITSQDHKPPYTTKSAEFSSCFFSFFASAMGSSSGVVGFVGLDDLNLELAASLVRSGYGVRGYEVFSSYFPPLFSILFSLNLILWIFYMLELCGVRKWTFLPVILFLGCSFLAWLIMAIIVMRIETIPLRGFF